jgi:hypothetical protein
LLIVEVERGEINLDKLTQAQQRADQLSDAMAGYIRWLAGQMEDLPGKLRENFEGARRRAISEARHLRIPEILSHLWLGLNAFLLFVEDAGACSAEQSGELRDRCWTALLELAAAQSRVVEGERPTRRFLEVLAALLIPDLAFTAVARFSRDSGENFPVRQYRLARDLAREGISECNPGRHTRMARVGGQIRRTLSLRRRAVREVLGEELGVDVSDVTLLPVLDARRARGIPNNNASHKSLH